MASMVPRIPGIVGGQEADQWDHQQAGVELIGSVVLGERSLVRVEALVADLIVDLLAHLLPAVDRSVEMRTPRAVLMARSMATHAMTLEWVKCRRGPRTSQMPSSGSRQPGLEEVHQGQLQLPGRVPSDRSSVRADS